MKPAKISRAAWLAATCLGGMAGAGLAEEPMSAIDWLKEPAPVTVAKPLVQPLGQSLPQAKPKADDVSGATVPKVDVVLLDTVKADAVGLLPASSTGLPSDLWMASSTKDITTRLASLPDAPLPALNALYYTLLLAEADPPSDVASDAPFLHARVAALREFGAVDAALALVERAGPQTDVLFDDWLELGLLRGTEDNACNALTNRPALYEDYAARVYCLVRSGDWATAALTYDSAQSLGLLSTHEADMLARFLHPELAEEANDLPPPREMTPLLFRLYEAAGTPLPTRTLPLEYAIADLRGTMGWRTEIEAAERLARTGALPANRLLGLYTSRQPAASGGIWDRVRDIQAFDSAMISGDADHIGRLLPDLWADMKDAGLGVVFATLYGERLSRLSLPGQAAIQQAIILLSPAYQTAQLPKLTGAEAQRGRFLAGLATGAPDATLAQTPTEDWIAKGFATTIPDPRYAAALSEGKLGQTLLDVANDLRLAQTSHSTRGAGALSTLRAIGLEDVARQTALQILLLGPS